MEERKEPIRILIDALRSGEYCQTTDVLRRGDCYCVLGVAAEEYRRATGNGAWSACFDDGTYAYTLPDSDGLIDHISVLPYVIADWYGPAIRSRVLVEAIGTVVELSLTELNDGVYAADKTELSRPRSFAEIADWLQKGLDHAAST